MVTLADVRWGSYETFEGPYLLGSEPYLLPPNPTAQERMMAVIAATEGGCYDSVNMYDSCVISVGFIQWCEANMFGFSNMLTLLLPEHKHQLFPLLQVLGECGIVEFERTSTNRGRFRLDDGRWVETLPLQKKVWLGGASGHKGEWLPETAAYARKVAVAVANLARKDVVKRCQVEYTATRLYGFVMQGARDRLFEGRDLPPMQYRELLQAAYLSYAANNPKKANEALAKAYLKLPQPWSIATVAHVLRHLTYDPGFAIYPGRYNKIRPVLEKSYGVDLPDFAEELKAVAEMPRDIPMGAPSFLTAKEVQKELLALGYDLGPRGADGIMGRKTQEVLRKFQVASGLHPDGVVGRATRLALLRSYANRNGQ